MKKPDSPKDKNAVCHIRSAWPEFGPAPALCGTRSYTSHGGMLAADCRVCLKIALNAGQHLQTSNQPAILSRLKRMRIIK